ncbi:type II toxin-antitoxin system RelE/ParE family toxin [Spirosoma spitsbergense]|jgi:plasmid stabilization system protein ParE|uniref:type II toxin-antitoxin system RelE/ParE family toxin n=1 Tax=Spirosoma spitsbergense TaxID=431554 RepID=UPI000376D4EB|nr:type II toxin-antitoxin system RelE/ParE family toxin [Spirosoma spitsbergense]
MAYPVVWTDNADRSLYELTDFLAQRWSGQIVEEYVDRIYDCIDSLSQFPEMGRVVNEDKDVRAFIILPYTRLYYQFKEGQVFLLRFTDTRQKPDRRDF